MNSHLLKPMYQPEEVEVVNWSAVAQFDCCCLILFGSSAAVVEVKVVVVVDVLFAQFFVRFADFHMSLPHYSAVCRSAEKYVDTNCTNGKSFFISINI